MYQCLDCGGDLKFDIPSQMLSCSYCNKLVSPYSVTKESDAYQNNFFEARFFMCPQCGGEICTVDNEIASFCNYCGASAVLTERMKNERCPDHIIPFKVTKEECKKVYEKSVKKAIFTPKELRSSKYIEGFRGIYMPYWTYDMSQNGEVSIKGKKTYREGEYEVTDYYNLNGNLSSRFRGDNYDASANFYDEISGALAPYDLSEREEFTPSFLSGFYADAADVSKEVYLDDAKDFTENTNMRKICKEPAFSDIHICEENGRPITKKWPEAKADHIWSALFPVWFLSYRNKDRVAYVTVNGQTGKVVADMPVDMKKYIFVSIIVSLLFFVYLNCFLILRPMVVLNLCLFLLLFTAIFYNKEMKKIYYKEHLTLDKGLFWKKENVILITRRKYASKKRLETLGIALLVILMYYNLFIKMAVDFITTSKYVAGIVMIGMILCEYSAIKMKTKIDNKKMSKGIFFSIIGTLISAVIFLFEPMSDIWFFVSIILIMVAIIFNLIDIVKYFNRIAMRRLPQYDKKGGNHSVE